MIVRNAGADSNVREKAQARSRHPGKERLSYETDVAVTARNRTAAGRISRAANSSLSSGRPVIAPQRLPDVAENGYLPGLMVMTSFQA
jgi:hypothetical protein